MRRKASSAPISYQRCVGTKTNFSSDAITNSARRNSAVISRKRWSENTPDRTRSHWNLSRCQSDALLGRSTACSELDTALLLESQRPRALSHPERAHIAFQNPKHGV